MKIAGFMRNDRNNARFAGILLAFMLGIYFILAVRNINENIDTFYGEADSYMLPTISILNHGTMIITEEDVEQAAEDFPELYETIRSRYDGGRMSVIRNGDGVNPFYFCTYSLACIPLKLLFKFWGLSQTPVFGYTNLLLIMGVCVYLFQRLKASILQRLCLVGLLLANPVYNYIPWQSAEVFIFCMVTLSLIHFMNREYRRSAFALSLAGTLNVTVMFFGFVLIFSFFYERMRPENKSLIFVVTHRFKEVAAFGSCFLIVFLPFIHNYVYVGEANSTFNMYESGSVLSRAWAYFFDMNFGIFAYYPLLFFMLVIILVHSVRKRMLTPILLFVSMLGVVFSYSLAYHINCGMSGISRYGSWTTPFLLFICVIFFPFHRAVKAAACGFWGTTAAVALLLSQVSLQTTYTQLTLWTQMVLDYVPQLYTPLYSTFHSRVSRTDGGYDYAESVPIVYWSEYDGCMRKALVNNESTEALLKICDGDEEALTYLGNAILENQDQEGFYYINIPRKYKIYRNLQVDEQGSEELEEVDLVFSDTPEMSAGGGLLYNAAVELKENTYYKVQVKYTYRDACRSADLVCDLYGGASYDNPEQEAAFTIYGKEGDEYYAGCVLFSGDISAAEEIIQVRVLNYSGNSEIIIDEIYVTEMEISG